MAKIVGMNGGGKPQKVSDNSTNSTGSPKIDLGKSKPIQCAHCGYDVFVDGSKFRKVSKLITGTPQDVIVPIPVLLCGNCGHICEELLPEQMKVLEEIDKRNMEKNE
jgi:DNA-directed RNA polymerase subunit RPC12/RpoP